MGGQLGDFHSSPTHHCFRLLHKGLDLRLFGAAQDLAAAHQSMPGFFLHSPTKALFRSWCGLICMLGAHNSWTGTGIHYLALNRHVDQDLTVLNLAWLWQASLQVNQFCSYKQHSTRAYALQVWWSLVRKLVLSTCTWIAHCADQSNHARATWSPHVVTSALVHSMVKDVR